MRCKFTFHGVYNLLGALPFSDTTFSSYVAMDVPITQTNVQCTGTESFLLSCPSSSPTDHCDHFQDAGVICYEGSVFIQQCFVLLG